MVGTQPLFSQSAERMKVKLKRRVHFLTVITSHHQRHYHHLLVGIVASHDHHCDQLVVGVQRRRRRHWHQLKTTNQPRSRSWNTAEDWENKTSRKFLPIFIGKWGIFRALPPERKSWVYEEYSFRT